MKILQMPHRRVKQTTLKYVVPLIETVKLSAIAKK